MKTELYRFTAQVGKQLTFGGATIYFGDAYPSWEDVPDSVLSTVEAVADTSLFDDVDRFFERTEGMSDLVVMTYARSLIPVDRLPSLKNNSAWVFWPSKGPSGYAYARVLGINEGRRNEKV